MAEGNVIDLTGDNAQERPIIDLTRDSVSPPARSKPNESAVTNGHREEASSSSKTARNRRRNKKTKTEDSQEPSHNEQDASGNKSLLQRIQLPAPEADQASTSSPKSLSKRKRRESVDSTVQTQAEARPPPPKRLKSQNLAPIPPNDSAPLSKDGKRKNKSKDKSRQSSVDRQAPSNSKHDQQANQNGGPGPSRKHSSSRNKKNNRSSQSPMPSTGGQGSSRNQKSASRARSASVNTVPPSPNTSLSGLFFVDTAPNADQKHLEEPRPSAYRVDSGNLLLPQHVLLESAEEALQTPGTEIYPPPTPGLSEGSIDVVDDSLRNVRRYWQPEPDTANLEECRTCGKFHTSKLCIGTSVCFTCGSTAHQARRCPFKISCYRCGLAGHIQADCPVAREDLKNSRDCHLCGSTGHGTHNCARNWRIYKYRDLDTREKYIEARIAMKPLVLAGDKSVDEEKYVGIEPWCYNCALMGHLGDDCQRERVDDRPYEPSAFGIANVLYGPFEPRYRRVADDLYKQLGAGKYSLFGDQLLDESALALLQDQPPHYGYDAPVPADMPLKPGMSGRQRERERLGRERRNVDEEDDWFSNRKERPAPVRIDRRDVRDRNRDGRNDRSRGNSGRDRERERDRDYGRNRREGGTTLYSTRDGYSNGYDRPPEPSMSPPPMPPPGVYPSSVDMAAGYHHSASSKRSDSAGLSIRGAAGRPRGDSYDESESKRRGYDRSGHERNHGGRSNDQHDRGYHRADKGSSGGNSGYRGGRDRDRYEDTRRRHDRY